MLYLSVEEVIEINQEILGVAAVRDIGLLESAVMRPQASAFGEDAYPTLIDKASAFMHSLILNHAFVAGNKRTATIALIDFLEINGLRVVWQPAEALEFIIAIAERQHEVADIARWLEAHTQSLSDRDPP